jgi:hypothetical protein
MVWSSLCQTTAASPTPASFSGIGHTAGVALSPAAREPASPLCVEARTAPGQIQWSGSTRQTAPATLLRRGCLPRGIIMRNIVRALIASAALLLAIPALAFAWPGDVEGAPNLTEQSPLGYYLWHDDNGMHLRTHGPGDEHLFVAHLHTDGTFQNVDSVRLENKDNFSVDDGGHELTLHFHTYDFTDGVNFTIDGGNRLHLRLELDGQMIDTGSIYLGSSGAHPTTDPFTIDR